MSAVFLGVLLGAVNVCVIALGLSAVAHSLAIGVIVAMFGMLPAIVLGALLGWTARKTEAAPVWLRCAVLMAPAMLLVFALGALFWMKEFVLVSCIPTAVAAVVLERRTRKVVPPVVPVAQVRR